MSDWTDEVHLSVIARNTKRVVIDLKIKDSHRHIAFSLDDWGTAEPVDELLGNPAHHTVISLKSGRIFTADISYAEFLTLLSSEAHVKRISK